MPASGSRVLVPLMRKQVRGIVLREHTEALSPDFEVKIKPILAVSRTTGIMAMDEQLLYVYARRSDGCGLAFRLG